MSMIKLPTGLKDISPPLGVFPGVMAYSSGHPPFQFSAFYFVPLGSQQTFFRLALLKSQAMVARAPKQQNKVQMSLEEDRLWLNPSQSEQPADPSPNLGGRVGVVSRNNKRAARKPHRQTSPGLADCLRVAGDSPGRQCFGWIRTMGLEFLCCFQSITRSIYGICSDTSSTLVTRLVTSFSQPRQAMEAPRC